MGWLDVSSQMSGMNGRIDSEGYREYKDGLVNVSRQMGQEYKQWVIDSKGYTIMYVTQL